MMDSDESIAMPQSNEHRAADLASGRVVSRDEQVEDHGFGFIAGQPSAVDLRVQ